MNRIALGTAQFGLEYGAGNWKKKVNEKIAASIIEYAKSIGVDTIDTAAIYGNSEAVLGQAGVANWKIYTKIPEIPEDLSNTTLWMKAVVKQSLERLNLSMLDGLLLHRPLQLHGKRGDEIYSSLVELKASGYTKSIGISIYEPRDLDGLLSKYVFDIVQSPFSVIDQRLLTSGWLKELKNMGVTIHVRSIFLKGVLLHSTTDLPQYFSAWSSLLAQWQEKLNILNITPLQACLGFVLSQPNIDKVIIGVQSKQQIIQVSKIASESISDSFSEICSEDLMLINPHLWPV